MFVEHAIEFVSIHQSTVAKSLEPAGVPLTLGSLEETRHTTGLLCLMSQYFKQWKILDGRQASYFKYTIISLLNRFVSILQPPAQHTQLSRYSRAVSKSEKSLFVALILEASDLEGDSGKEKEKEEKSFSLGLFGVGDKEKEKEKEKEKAKEKDELKGLSWLIEDKGKDKENEKEKEKEKDEKGKESKNKKGDERDGRKEGKSSKAKKEEVRPFYLMVENEMFEIMRNCITIIRHVLPRAPLSPKAWESSESAEDPDMFVPTFFPIPPPVSDLGWDILGGYAATTTPNRPQLDYTQHLSGIPQSPQQLSYQQPSHLFLQEPYDQPQQLQQQHLQQQQQRQQPQQQASLRTLSGGLNVFLAGLAAFADARGARAKVERVVAKTTQPPPSPSLKLAQPDQTQQAQQTSTESNATTTQHTQKNKALLLQVLHRTKDQEKVLLYSMEASLQVILAHVMMFLFGRYREERESKHRLREIGNEIDTFLVRLVRNLTEHAKRCPEQPKWNEYVGVFTSAKAYFKYLFDL